MDNEAMECPFCGWKAQAGEYEMMLHIETLHSEGPSPFVVEEDSAYKSGGPGNDHDPQYVECPSEGCGELLLLEELDYHLELHTEESGDHLQRPSVPHSERDTQPATGPSATTRSHPEAEKSRRSEHAPEPVSRQAKAISVWKRLLRMPGSSSADRHQPRKHRHDETHTTVAEFTRGKRLGKTHLGKYAHEERMPDWLVTLLRKEGQVVTHEIIPVIARLLEQSPSTEYAYICHPCVWHVSKLKREGGFCGYRNIQMVCSYILMLKVRGYEHLGTNIPSIFQIQEYIETAWDRGIHANGRLETGGIRGTRKYIGTPEALAMFRLLDVPCDAKAIKHDNPAESEADLMQYVETYFQGGVQEPSQRIRRTQLGPIYFQHAGHSLTIIGFEKLKNGDRNLLVFDPSFRDSADILSLSTWPDFVHPKPDLALKPYRRGSRYLRMYHQFELLTLRAPWTP